MTGGLSGAAGLNVLVSRQHKFLDSVREVKSASSVTWTRCWQRSFGWSSSPRSGVFSGESAAFTLHVI